MEVEEVVEREDGKNLEVNTAIQEVTATIAGAEIGIGIGIGIVMGLGGTVAPLRPIEIKAAQGDTGRKCLLLQCTI